MKWSRKSGSISEALFTGYNIKTELQLKTMHFFPFAYSFMSVNFSHRCFHTTFPASVAVHQETNQPQGEILCLSQEEILVLKHILWPVAYQEITQPRILMSMVVSVRI